MRWLLGNTQFIGIVIAALAICLSFLTALLNRRQRRQDMFLRVQDMLTDIDIAQGRFQLHKVAETGYVPTLGAPERFQLSRCLSVHNTVATYVRRGIVPKRWVLDSWHHSLQDLRQGVAAMVRTRQEMQQWRPWADLDWLITLAEKHRTQMPCCQMEIMDKREQNASGDQAQPEWNGEVQQDLARKAI